MIAASNVDLRIGERTLLEAMTFSIQAGELVAVLGPNGAGKTTLMRAIAGMHPVARGTLQILGRPVQNYSSSERGRTIAFMVSDDAPVESMPVRDAVAGGRYAYHHWWDWRETPADAAVIEEALRAVNMTQFSARNFGTLSSGERQRVWLALGLAQEAPLFLLDEPTSHLDVRVSHEILELLRVQAREGKTVVCVLHDMNEALEFAGRLMVLGEGRILAFDTPDRIVHSGVLDRAYGMPLEALATPSGQLRVFPHGASAYPHAT